MGDQNWCNILLPVCAVIKCVKIVIKHLNSSFNVNILEVLLQVLALNSLLNVLS